MIPRKPGLSDGWNTQPKNRAERRQYIRYIQPSRQVRMNAVGFGKWRKPREKGESRCHYARNPQGHHGDRQAERDYQLLIYRSARNARLGRG